MMGTSRVSPEPGTECALQEADILPVTVSWDDAQIAALAAVLENLIANPGVLAKTLTLACGEGAGQTDTVDGGLDLVRRYFQAAAEEMAENRNTIVALRTSWSWKLTAPLRSFLDGARLVLGVIRNGGRGLMQPARIAGIWQWLRFRKQVEASGLFDEQYYLYNNPDVRSLRISPLLHFFSFGAREDRNPHYLFDVRYYRTTAARAGVAFTNPLVHYLMEGAYKGCDPHPLFDSSFYLEQNPDVREAGVNPLAHYLAPGIVEGRNPNGWFETLAYIEQHPDIAARGLNPLAHYAELRLRADGRHG